MQNVEINFLGWTPDSGARFEILSGKLPESGEEIGSIRVIHEGEWLSNDAMICHREFEKYEDAQKRHGKGLKLARKEYDKERHHTIFEYEVETLTAILGCIATGEDFYFQIYGAPRDSGNYELLLEREL